MDFFRAHVLVCGGAACISSGCRDVQEAFVEALKEHGLDKEIKIVTTGCMGPCDLGPLAIVYPEGVLYRKLRPADAREIVEEHLLKGRTVKRLLYEEPATGEVVPTYNEMSFFNRQVRIALRNTGKINPLLIEEYIALDGYAALARVLSEMTPQEVIDVVKRSGLRGRGGGGFPTGLKWEFTAKARSDQKYVVCNADEGDPGAFMDRSVLEGDPHSIIEAMAIAGYAVGANQGYIYVRAEYPLAIKHLDHAIKQARDYGLLGKDIFGKGFDFDVEIRVGAGAFVCGEETALLASIEGRRGEPRPRPPFPANEGLWGKPTLINNVETYANIPVIILKGPEWFASIGTEKSKGTKVFALAGKINNTGLVEVPMGMSLGEIIFDIGGGIPGGKKFKAAQTGGPSGGCIPKEYLNVPVDYDSLKELGTIMGSGGLIIMDEDTCMVDLAKFFLEFTQDESCGKCAPCRIGTKRMLEILTRITRGEGREGDVERLIKLGQWIKETALCGLGQTAPNPVLTTIRYFRDEYDAHIRDKKCPASVCASLFESACQNACPAEVDVPRYISLIRQGRYGEAVALIKEKNPLPAVCGRVCNHPCESKCRRGQLDSPVAICDLKRFAADWELEHPLPVEAPTKRKGAKVAIIGSGPAGLSAAYYLAKLGYVVTIFEALPVAGGMLAVGIPEYRLPRDILRAEIRAIEALGVEIRTGVEVGRDITLDEIKRQGYGAVFVAVGASKGQELGVPGEDLAGVMNALTFLRQVNLGQEVEVGDKVAVIGGGNAAIDAARTALRLGASEVHIIYRRTREEMPAEKGEIEEAGREGVKIHYLLAPSEIIGKDGRVARMECIRMTLGEFDRSGRRKPVPVEGSKFVIDVDTVIPAVSQAPDLSFLAGLEGPGGIDVTKWSTVVADPQTLATGAPGIFAGGDCVTGPDTVIQAIAAGRKAAIAIDKYLGGDGVIETHPDLGRELAGELIEHEMARRVPRVLPIEKRCCNFDEVVLGLTEAAAVEEASRCLRCDFKEQN
ncbi:MAG: NADH-quinone oxidoreductase subunit NuoF [Firmicutes bacterium]|nr:NADH-quinone oxidoreductase subunit NuoF [Bacillota bacterium]